MGSADRSEVKNIWHTSFEKPEEGGAQVNGYAWGSIIFIYHLGARSESWSN